MPSDPNCMLCEAAKMTHWYLEDELCWVADCDICDTPMVVWWEHGLPDEGGELHESLLDRLRQVAGDLYGGGGFWIDGFRPNIPNHWHSHAPPQAGFICDSSPTRQARSGGA